MLLSCSPNCAHHPECSSCRNPPRSPTRPHRHHHHRGSFVETSHRGTPQSLGSRVVGEPGAVWPDMGVLAAIVALPCRSHRSGCVRPEGEFGCCGESRPRRRRHRQQRRYSGSWKTCCGVLHSIQIHADEGFLSGLLSRRCNLKPACLEVPKAERGLRNRQSLISSPAARAAGVRACCNNRTIAILRAPWWLSKRQHLLVGLQHICNVVTHDVLTESTTRNHDMQSHSTKTGRRVTT